MLQLLLTLTSFSFSSSSSKSITCNENWCPSSYRGDGYCDTGCMYSFCNWDSETSSGDYDFSTSDCYETCVYNNGCDPSDLGDDYCDDSCNIAACGYDLGDCGYCDQNCYSYMLGSYCYDNCNTTACYYGESYCSECSSGCTSSKLGDGTCDSECNTASCNYDFGDCSTEVCSPGCYSYMIDDGVCNSECYNSACNWDNKDCDCSPGCNSDKLNNSDCDSECDNSDCSYDNGKCGDCASGCFTRMIGDKNCDSKCYNSNCKYDAKDCRCTSSCTNDKYGTCDENCLVGDCLYDQFSTDSSKHCTQNYNQLFHMHAQLINNDLTTVRNLADCSSNGKCDGSMLLTTYGTCTQDCDTKNCAYSWAACSPENMNTCADSKCQKCYGTKQGQCYQCDQANSYQFYGYCLETCPVGYSVNYISSLNYPLCLPSADTSTSANPKYYYVTTLGSTDPMGGDGTQSNPFESLALALTAINSAYAIVYLNNDGDGIHYLTQLNSTNPMSVVAPDSAKPYNSQTNRQSLIIMTENSATVHLKPKVDWSLLTITTQNTVSLTIANVIFDGDEWAHGKNNCLGGYCSYCPTVTQQYDGSYKDDQGNAITDFAESTQCQKYHNQNLIEVTSGTTLILNNVQFNNWRMELNSIIQNNGGNLDFTNTNFDNIRNNPASGSAVILFKDCMQSSSNSYGCGDFTYKTGSVARINNGFEYSSSLTLKGFFRSTRSQAISFKSITFENNAVYSATNSVDDSLIYLEIFKTLTIDSCTFSYNYVYSSLIYLKATNLELNYDVNSKDEITDYLIDHVTITGSTFIYNYGVTYGIFAAVYQIELQNINWNNVEISNNGVEKGPIIYISNGIVQDRYIYGQTAAVSTSKGKVNAFQRQRTFYWKTLTFDNNNSGSSGLWDFTKLVNLYMDDIQITSNGATNNTVNTLVFKPWKDNTNIHLKTLSASPAFLDFTSLASMSTMTNFTMISSKITGSVAYSSTPYVLVSSSNINVFNDVTISGNTGKSTKYPTSLYINGGNETHIMSCSIKSNENLAETGYGAIGADGSALNMTINETTFESNIGTTGGGLFFAGVNLYMYDNTFNKNTASKNGGGVCIQQTATGRITITAVSCTFSNNLGSSYGGGLYFENVGAVYNSIIFNVESCTFTENTGGYGSAIYMGSALKIYEYKTSSIVSTTFSKNNATSSGTLSALFADGTFYIENCEFSSNIGRVASGIYLETATESDITICKTLMKSIKFTSNSGAAVLYMTNSDVYSHIETDTCTFSSNTGIPVWMDYDYWIDSDSVIENNSGKASGGIKLLDASFAKCTNTVFSSNTATQDGGAVSLGSASTFYCLNCTFEENTAGGSGGAIFSEQKSYFNITNSFIYQNECTDKGAAIYMLGSSSPTSLLKNSTVHENSSANQASIALLDSSINIDTTTVYKNTATSITPGMLLTLSDATISNSKFYSQSGDQGSFIYATTQSEVDMYNSTFTDGVSTSSAGAIFSISSTVTMDNCTFTRSNATTGGGGAILAYSSSILTIKNSFLTDSYSKDVGGVINSYESDLEVSKTVMKNYKWGAIYGSKMNSVKLENSQFLNGVGASGGALTCVSCESITITSCTFESNTAEEGGALYLSTSSDTEITNPYIIKSSTFNSNSAILGGGIYTNNINLNVSNSEFTGNNATTTETNTGSIPTTGNGGGINLACTDFTSCVFNLTSNKFFNNTATYNGGGINWEDISPSETNNTFKGNKASYAAEISSFAIKLMSVDANGKLVDYTRRLEDNPTATSISGIASGQETTSELRLALVDYYGNIVLTDSSSTAQLYPTNSTSTTLSGTTKATAQKGVYYFPSFIVSAEPGSDVSIYVTSTGIDTSKQSKLPGATFTSTVDVAVSMRECIIGEATVGVNCEVCASGFYSLDPSNTQCLTCPSHSATCYGNWTMAPQSGYWRSGKYSDNFIACPNSAACLGGAYSSTKNLSYTGECSTGYTGNLCQACDTGYSRSSSNTCGKCPDEVTNSFKVIGICILVIIVCGVMVRTTRNSAYKPKAIHSVYIKIFANYLQMIMLMTTFDLSWPSLVVDLFAVQSQAGSVSEQAYSFDCFLDTGQGMDQVYFNKLILMSLIPIVIGLISLLFWGTMAIYKRSAKTFKNDLISTIVILLFLFHPNLVKAMFGVFSCRELDSGEYWLVDNLDIRCWNSRHIFYSLVVAVPSIIVWGIGIPTVSLFFLWRNKRALDTISVRLKFGFLFNGYKYRAYYWEFIILYRKILIVCCSVFLANISTSIQALTVMILLLFCLYLQNDKKPYNGEVLNQMELRSIMVASVTIYCGLYYLTDSLDSVSENVFFFVICGINIYFLNYWVKKMFGAYLQIASDLVPCLRKRFSRRVLDGLSDDIFEKKHPAHVIVKEGDKFFSIIPGDDPVPSIPLDDDLEKALNSDMRDLFLGIVHRHANEKNRKVEVVEDLFTHEGNRSATMLEEESKDEFPPSRTFSLRELNNQSNNKNIYY
ncbi:unnamed protein product [Blepharisma stoltei]|uniref:TNFR-Cys domain-containing protein n=1 Tax=Blepharisma stoltei TaxID=1481888 RepID=A0AAU9JK58_9CILI|nr:unnamed protein product [Blepharisma stoltei]